MLEIILGMVGAMLILGAFYGGIHFERNRTNAGRKMPVEMSAEEKKIADVTEEKLKAEREAFEQQMGYSVATAYQMARGVSEFAERQ